MDGRRALPVARRLARHSGVVRRCASSQDHRLDQSIPARAGGGSLRRILLRALRLRHRPRLPRPAGARLDPALHHSPHRPALAAECRDPGGAGLDGRWRVAARAPGPRLRLGNDPGKPDHDPVLGLLQLFFVEPAGLVHLHRNVRLSGVRHPRPRFPRQVARHRVRGGPHRRSRSQSVGAGACCAIPGELQAARHLPLRLHDRRARPEAMASDWVTPQGRLRRCSPCSRPSP